MKVGTQVIYVPDIANGDMTHPDCLRGFVISNYLSSRTVYLVPWQPNAVGIMLRSGRPLVTDRSHLVVVDSVEQDIVNEMLALT